MGTACLPAEATLTIAPGAACRRFGFLVIAIVGQPLQALLLVPVPPSLPVPLPPVPLSPPWVPPSREVAEALGPGVAEEVAPRVAEAEALAVDVAFDALAEALAFGVAVAELLADADPVTSAAGTVPAECVAEAAGDGVRAAVALRVAVADELAVGDAEFLAFSAVVADFDDFPGMRVSGAKGVPPAKATPSTAA